VSDQQKFSTFGESALRSLILFQSPIEQAVLQYIHSSIPSPPILPRRSRSPPETQSVFRTVRGPDRDGGDNAKKAGQGAAASRGPV